MRFFLDANMPRRCQGVLLARGHEVEHARDIGMGMEPDAKIAEHAKTSNSVLVTRDLDFADVRTYPPEKFHGVIVMRVPEDAVAEEIASLLERFLRHASWVQLLPGRLCILEPNRVRFRPAADAVRQ